MPHQLEAAQLDIDEIEGARTREDWRACQVLDLPGRSRSITTGSPKRTVPRPVRS